MSADVAREAGARLRLVSGQGLGVERMLASGSVQRALREVARLLRPHRLQQVLGEPLGPGRRRVRKAQVDPRVAREGGAP